MKMKTMMRMEIKRKLIKKNHKVKLIKQIQKDFQSEFHNKSNQKKEKLKKK